MSSLYISSEMKSRLIAAARRRGYRVERGPGSELQQFIAYLLELEEDVTRNQQPTPPTYTQALGLLADGISTPTDDEIREILAERRVDL